MRKSRHKTDLNIKPEVTREFIWELNRAIKAHAKTVWPGDLDYDSDLSAYQRKHGLLDSHITAVHYLKRNFLSKYYDAEGAASPAERRTRAIVKWLGVEQRNARTNRRILTLSNDTKHVMGDGSPIYMWDVLFRARRICFRIIGDGHDVDLLNGGMTSGASTSKRRSVDSLSLKFTEKMDATDRLREYIPLLGDTYTGWSTLAPRAFDEARVVSGNVLFTVPKNAEIDRVACKEPDLNLFCQKSLGGEIRRALRKRARIDLNDQTKNQHLAQQAYKRKLCTIDLSSASDSMTIELVRAIVPPRWFELLSLVRSPVTIIDGEEHVNNMFSSMGNGATFELESLIFYCLAKAVSELEGFKIPTGSVIGVYGDDLIINRSASALLIKVLGFCGFKTNVDKTFIEGPIFESCGKHYCADYDVSPFFIRHNFSDVSDLVLSLNQLRSWMIRTGIDLYETYAVDQPQYTFYDVWKKYCNLVPRSLHGGWDLTSRVQLVTPGQHRCRLEPVMIEKRGVAGTYQLGMYLARLRQLDLGADRADLEAETMETNEFPRIQTNRWVIRRFRDTASFFGIATEPLHQEMKVTVVVNPIDTKEV